MQRDFMPMVAGLAPHSPFLVNTNVLQTHFCDLAIWRTHIKERLLKVGRRLPMCLPDIYVQGLTKAQKEKLPFATVQKWFCTNKPYEGLPVSAPRELVEMFDVAVTNFISGALVPQIKNVVSDVKGIKASTDIMAPEGQVVTAIPTLPQQKAKKISVRERDAIIPRPLFDEQERTHLYGGHVWALLSQKTRGIVSKHRLSEVFKEYSDDSRLPQNVVDEISAAFAKIPSWAAPVTSSEVMSDIPFGTEYSPVMSQRVAADQLTKAMKVSGMARSVLTSKFSEVTGVSHRAAANLFNQGIDTVPRLRAAICYAIVEGAAISEEAIQAHRHFSEGRMHKNPRPKMETQKPLRIQACQMDVGMHT